MKRFSTSAALAGLVLACWAAPGAASERGEADLVSALRANGAEVVSLGSRGGLDGYFVTPPEGAGYGLYVTGDGHAVAGLLYGPDGTEVTGDQLAAARPAKASRDGAGSPERAGVATTAAHAASDGPGAVATSASRATLFERIAAAFGFTLGNRGPVVVLLGDATCPWSRSAAARLGRAALDGRLQLRVVPVAVLGGDAARRAVAIAAHPEPARVWFEGGGASNPRAGDTRARDTRARDRTGAERIARNNALFDAWGAGAVPLIAWRAPGGAVGHRVGDIDDVAAWLWNTLGVGDGP